MDTLAFYQSFVDKLGCPVFILDVREGAIAAINDEAVQRLGYSREECRGLSLERLISPSELPTLDTHGGVVKVRHRDDSKPKVAFRASAALLNERDCVLLIGDREPSLKNGSRTAPSFREPASEFIGAFELIQELLDCRDVDALCRRAEELARGRLGLQKCALWLKEGQDVDIVATPGSRRKGTRQNARPVSSLVWTDPKSEGWQVWESDPRIWTRTQWASPRVEGPRVPELWDTAIEVRTPARLLGVLFCHTEETQERSLTEVAAYCSALARIIERKRFAVELEENAHIFQSFEKNPAVGLIAASMDQGRILWANGVLEQITGFVPGEIKGRFFSDLFFPEDVPEMADILGLFVKGEVETCCKRSRLVRRDDTPAWVHLTFSVSPGGRGQPAHLVIVVEDISGYGDAERQRQTLKEGLHLITTAASEMLACTSLDQLCRKAVELVRERLGLERTGLFLLDREGKLHGTYGTTLEGDTSDEHGLLYDQQSWAGEFLPPWNSEVSRWVVPIPDRSVVNEEHPIFGDPSRWLAVTPICSAEGPIGIFCNDNAISGSPWNESAQELVTMLSTVLGTIIREKRVEEELWRVRLSLEQRVRERTAQLDLANTALQLEICERKRAERELRSVAKHARCILWYAKIQGLPGWEQDKDNANNFKWRLHVQDEAAAQKVLPLEVPPGKSYADVLGESLTNAAEMRLAAITALREGSDSYDQEFCCRDMFGQLRWLREDVQLQRLSADRWEAFGLTTDVSIRKQAREEILRLNKDLQDRVTELQTLLDTAPIGIAIATDQNCSEISVNPYLARLLGISPEPNAFLNAPLQLRPSEFTLCRDGKELAPDQVPMRLAASGQTVTYVELDLMRSDGEIVPVMSSAVPLLDIAGSPRGCVAAFIDISERIRAEEGLRNVAAHTGCILWHGELKEIKRSEEELQQGFPRFAWRVQIQDEKAAQKVLPLDVLPGNRYEDMWQSSQNPEDKARIESLCAANLQAGKNSWSHEYRCTNRFGEVQWFFESVRLKRRRPGRWQVFGVFLDMTERKRANEEMSRLAAIVESSDDAIISATRDGFILTWNAGAERLFGYSPDEVKGKQISMLIPEDHDDEAREIEEQVSSGKQIPTFETVRLRKDGSTVQVSLSVSPVRDPSGKITGVALTARDVSSSKRLEKDVLDISAHEQQRIGQDLHDGICQQLTGAYFLTSVLKHKLEAQENALATDASQVATLLSTVTEQARQLARGLHPLETGPKGLITALEELADQITHLFKIECRFVCDQDIVISDSATATHLYRIAQEASNNAVRHGEATHINIELRQNSGEIWLIVEDNGKGFHNEIDSFSGMGLRTMRYRAGVIGGKLIVESGRPGGTLICCVLPIRHACAPGEKGGGEKLHSITGD